MGSRGQRSGSQGAEGRFEAWQGFLVVAVDILRKNLSDAVADVVYSFLLVISVVAQSVQNLLKRSVKKLKGFLPAHSK